MSEVLERPVGGGIRERGGSAVLVAVNWLGLAATPVFVVMAGLTADPAGGNLAMICVGGQVNSWLSGMTPMYLLMGAVHARPWLMLIDGRGPRNGGES